MFCFPTAMLQDYSATSYFSSFRLVCTYMQSFVLSLPFLAMKSLVSHLSSPGFSCSAGPWIAGKTKGSRALVQDCCSSSSDSCMKNLSAFSWPQTGMSLPASTFLWGTSHHFCPLQPQKQQDAGCMPEMAGPGEDILQQTRDPHEMLWFWWLSPM